MLDLRSCPVCGKLTDAGDKTCPHCGTIFGKKTQAQKDAFVPPVPVPDQKFTVPREVLRPVPPEKTPVPEARPPQLPGRPAGATGGGGHGIRVDPAIFRYIAMVIFAVVILALAIIVLPSLSSFANSPGQAAAPSGDSGETYTAYTNPSLGFSLRYPGSWTTTESIEPGGQGITDVKFSSPDNSAGLLVQVEDLAGTTVPATLDDWSASTLGSLGSGRQDFSLVANERTTIAGNPAQKYEFSWVTGSGMKMRSVMFLTIRGSKVYNLAFVMPDSRAAETAGVRQTIAGSLALT